MSNDQNKKGNKWLALINIPIQMGVIIFAFVYAGKWLDEKYPNENNLYVKILVIVGVAIAIYNVNRQVQEINKSDE
ncbi:MAG: AtpZ/AtpI family protein [Flavobacterium sp.]|uniref:AtpZ/AtpI family protein n=1 Tax=Flavobacterium sp. TaxID=239 RepID=UPI0012133874|nr:AtpZ/AtpI family protein [Flavobacterium sp.]RZJ67884.1 MAG: AtpZ/AtpI family protein [Flavobacterium sp.]